jgi:flavodoxin
MSEVWFVCFAVYMRAVCAEGIFHMDRLRILVVFYSRSGTTRTIALALAKLLRCDLEEIIEPKSRIGISGYLRSLVEALLKRPASITAMQRKLAAYDLVIIGTPVWCSSLSSPVRAYLTATAAQLPKVAFFCSFGGSGSNSTFAQMTAVIGKKPGACCAITQQEVQLGTYGEPLSKFAIALAAMNLGARAVDV